MAKLSILVIACLSLLVLGVFSEDRIPIEPVVYNGKVYVHIMPWFETRESSGDGSWGQHWTMANRNPDIIDGSGKRQIAAYYYPEIGPYASGNRDVIENQLLLMKYAGVSGVLIDWPGTVNAWDYPKNLQNSEAIIRETERIGLEFAIVYEDHNLGMAWDAGFIRDSIIEAGKRDMSYIRDNYFNKPNYIKINGAPLLLDFGPQTLKSPSDWSQLFSVLPQKPTFLTLWYQSQEAEGSSSGEYNWIYSDFLEGLLNFYRNRPLNVKMGVGYPGFRTFYTEGGWPGPGWGLPHEGTETFSKTLDLAIQNNINWIQIATWNDYGEGTMIEPTREFGNGFLQVLQQKRGLQYTERELNLVKSLYYKRLQYVNDKAKSSQLDLASDALKAFKPDEAAKILETL